MRFPTFFVVACVGVVSATGCGAVRSAVREQRWYDACRASEGLKESVAPWSDLDRAGLGEELRSAHKGTLRARVVPREELAAALGGAELLKPSDDSIGVIELRADDAILEDVTFDVKFASVHVARIEDDDVALFHELSPLLALPSPPERRIVKKPNELKNALGVVGIVTLVTPLATVLSGHDAMSPLLGADEEVVEPTPQEWASWRADPAMDAARKLRAFLREKDGRCDDQAACTLRAMLVGPELGTFDVTALRVRLRYVTHGQNGGTCAVDDRVLVRLPKGPGVIAQVRSAFPAEGLRFSGLETARAGSVSRWWYGDPDAERITRDDDE